MDVRPEIRADERAIGELVGLAFGIGAPEPALVTDLREAESYVPDLALVAVQAGTVVGHVMFTLVDLVPDGDGPAQEVLALAPLAVHPSQQGQGVGRALVEAGLRRCARRAEPFVVVIGGPEYFPRLNFVPASEMGVHTSFPVKEGSLQVRRLPAFRSAKPGTLSYPAAFDRIH